MDVGRDAWASAASPEAIGLLLPGWRIWHGGAASNEVADSSVFSVSASVRQQAKRPASEAEDLFGFSSLHPEMSATIRRLAPLEAKTLA